MHIVINDNIYTDAQSVTVRLITSSTGTESIQVFFNETDSLLITNAANVISIDGAPVSLGMSALASALNHCTEFVYTGNYEPAIAAGTTLQYWRGDKTWQTLPVYDPILFSVLNGDIATTSTSFVDVGNTSNSLKFPVVSGGVYWFRFTILFHTGTTGRGSAWAINGPALTQLMYRAEWSLTTTGRTIADGLLAYDATVANATCADKNSNVAIIEGIVQCSSAGDIIARFLSANSGNTITAKKYSSVQYKKLN